MTTNLKPTHTIEQCLEKVPESLAKHMRDDDGCPVRSALRLGDSFWVSNPHSKDAGEHGFILAHTIAELKQIKASWYLLKGGKSEYEHRRLLEKCFISASPNHGKYDYRTQSAS